MGGAGVAIVGMAGIFPGAPDVATFWDNIRSGLDATGPVPAGRVDARHFDGPDAIGCRRGGFVDDVARVDPARFGIMPASVDGAEPDQLLSVAVASAALDDAGYGDDLAGRDRIGVVVGRGGYLTAGMARLDQRVRGAHQVVETLREVVPSLGADELESVRRAFVDQVGEIAPDAAIGLVPNLVASRVANRLDLHGPAYAIDAACASSLVAVENAVRELESGRCDLMLAGGVHHCHDITLWSVFSQLGALSPTEEIRPFSEKADGLLIGEGTGMVVLKRLADAERDHDRIYAVVRGVGIASDGRSGSLMSPSVAGQVLAIERAWREAALDPSTVGLIEAHGTATPVGDEVELRTLTHLFGDGDAPVAVGSVKSMIGHAMPACGVASLIKATWAVHDGVLPPTLHCEDPHVAFSSSRLFPSTVTAPWEGEGPRRAGVNAFGFGGIDAHVVLEQHGARAARAGTPRLTESSTAGADLLLFSGSNAEELRARVGADVATCRPDIAGRGPGGPVRLAVADPSPRRLATVQKVLDRGNPWRGRNDIWFTDGGLATAGGRIAFLYPGVEPVFDPEVDTIADRFGLERPDMVWSDDLEGQGYGIVAVGRLITAALSRLGVVPHAMAGHSIGEWTAMITSGCLPDAAVDRFLDDLDPGSLEVPDLVYAAVGAGADVARAAIVDLDAIAVSHDNCPRQSILCGHREPLETALGRLKAQKVLCQELPFRSGFHSPMFEPWLGPIREKQDTLPLVEPAIPLWSATTATRFPGDEAGKRALARRLFTEPVRFRELIAALYDDGVRLFVQPGTGSVTGFVDDTLDGHDVFSVSTLSPKRSGLAQFERAVAALWVEGVDVDVDALLPSRPRAGEVGSTRRAPSTGSPLELGAPLVRLGAAAPTLVSAATARTRSGGVHGRLGQVFDDVFDEAVSARDEVLSAWAGTAAVTADDPVGVTAPPSAGPPVRGPARAVEWRRAFSLDQVPELADHSFFRQPDDATPADRFPVVPMTMLLDVMTEIAEQAMPGARVVALENVRALRWLVVDPPTDVTVRADPDGPDRVRVRVGDHARGTAVMADRYPDPAAPSLTLPDESPPVRTAQDMYADRWMFHGPAYRSVASLDGFAPDGVRGTVRPLDGPGSLLDGAGQLFGYWMMQVTDHDRVAFPARLESVSFSGPPPERDDVLSTVVKIREVTDSTVTADLELTCRGGVWCRIDGWSDRRFESDPELFELFLFPERSVLGDELAPGVVVVHEPCHDSASRELLARQYLDAAERDEYAACTPRAQRDLLVGRIAAKDAVRRRLFAAGRRDVYPIEIHVGHDERGRPVASGCFDADLRVSVSHRLGVGAAIVADGRDVGVDVERVEDRGGRFADLALGERERELVGRDPDDLLLTRVWSAKEAAAKARGTGLGGRPQDFEVTGVDDDAVHVDGHRVVHQQRGEFLVSWTTVDD